MCKVVSQLLAGPLSGSGGSSVAARELRCDEARRRRPSSRVQDASRARPSTGRGDVESNRGLRPGDKTRIASPRRKPGSRGNEHRACGPGCRLFAGMTRLFLRGLYLGMSQVWRDGEAARLAGLAPIARDSGKTSAPRHIEPGHAAVRRTLYMAAGIAMRFNPQLAAFALRLRARGKPFKVI